MSRVTRAVLSRRVESRAGHEPAIADAASRVSRSGGVSNSMRQHALGVQAKLAVSAPGDAYEREADRVADEVMRMPAPAPAPPAVSSVPARAQRQCVACEAADHLEEGLVQRDTRSPFSEDEGTVTGTSEADEVEVGDGDVEAGEVEETVQTKRADGASGASGPSLAASGPQLATGGTPLPRGVRGAMEARLGRDLGAVRVHTGARADTLARSINARAFTFGASVVFANGQYDPESNDGTRLLAHELVHVAQQGRAPFVGDRLGSSEPMHPLISSAADPRRLWRVRWNPNRPTGQRSQPWGTGPDGDVLRAATDAGGGIDIWRPDDGATYWCHGYTFGGSTARGGPYSIWGSTVPKVFADDGWQSVYSCLAARNDILVFWDRSAQLTHSGRIRTLSVSGSKVDESASTLESKWGNGPHNTSSWAKNAKEYGKYRVYSKSGAQGPCAGFGANELT